MVVRPRLGILIFWPKVERINDSTWREMERYWRENVELRCRDCGKTFTTEGGLADHAAVKHPTGH